jgi:hypothetical protein
MKLGVVASHVVGVPDRAMLEAILQGEQDPAKLAEMARGTSADRRARPPF